MIFLVHPVKSLRVPREGDEAIGNPVAESRGATETGDEVGMESGEVGGRGRTEGSIRDGEEGGTRRGGGATFQKAVAAVVLVGNQRERDERSPRRERWT